VKTLGKITTPHSCFLTHECFLYDVLLLSIERVKRPTSLRKRVVVKCSEYIKNIKSPIPCLAKTTRTSCIHPGEAMTNSLNFLIIGDVHITRKSIKRSTEMLNRIIQHAERLKPDGGVVFLGDVGDTHDYIQNECWTLYHEVLERLTKQFEVFHILGNHEMSDSKTVLPKIHAMNAFKGRKNLHVVDRPMKFEKNGVRFAGIPYTPVGTFSELIQPLESFKPGVVYAHQEFQGTLLSRSLESVSADVPPEWTQVISGHIHGNQYLTNLWYPGTPCQHNFGEDEDKWIFLIKVTNKGFTVVEKIDLGMPKMLTRETNCSEARKYLELNDGNIYRLAIVDTPANIAAFKKTDIYKRLAMNLRIKFDPVLVQTKREERDRNISFEELFKKHVQEHNLESAYQDIFN
jgi:DNA repair exonuclease SbcCD nuclease subunit